MKIPALTTFVLLAAVPIRADSPAQDAISAELAVEQIALTALYPGVKACDARSYPRNVALASFTYRPVDNHHPDADSNGTTITISR